MATSTVDTSNPPAYIDTDVGHLDPFHDPSDPPAYAGRQVQHKEFTYDIGRKGHDNLKLTLNAQQRLSANIPVFVGNMPLTGTALLEIQKPSPALEILIIVRSSFLIPYLNGGQELNHSFP